MFEFTKLKFSLIAVGGLGLFVLGRATAPKPQPQIKIVDNAKSVEKAIENTKKQMTEALQKQIVLETHTVRSKSGSSKTDVKEIITYNNNSTENTRKITENELQTSDKKTLDLKQKSLGIDLTVIVGRSFSFSDTKYDYLASIGIPLPLFSGIKANAGYEFNHKIVFIGGTLTF